MDNDILKLLNKAGENTKKAKYKESLLILKKGLSLSKRRSDINGMLDSTIALANIYRMTGDFDSAIKHYENALEISESIGDDIIGADAMAGLGLSIRAIGRWKDAVKFISAARKIYKKTDDQKGIGFSIWAEAGALRVGGDITRTIKKFHEAMDIFNSLKFQPGIAYSMCGLGGAHRIAGKYKDSMNYYKKANKMFQSQKDKFGTAYSHCGIGNAYRMINNYKDAIKHFKKASRLYEDIGDIVSYSYTLWSFANVYKMKKDFLTSRNYINKALTNFKKTKDPRGIIYCSLTLGEMEFMEGNHASAKRRFLSALNSAAKHDFMLEKCHAEVLLQNAISGLIQKKPGCYKKIGVDCAEVSMPFNMP